MNRDHKLVGQESARAISKDRLTREHRSWNMSRIRGKDTTPEKVVRSMLHRMGYRFRLNVKIPIELEKQEGAKRVIKYARPDIVLPKYKTAIFVHGCFWHACPLHGHTPNTNRGYWLPKLKRNKLRDQRSTRRLRRLGWAVLRIWEHELANEARVSRRCILLLNQRTATITRSVRCLASRSANRYRTVQPINHPKK